MDDACEAFSLAHGTITCALAPGQLAALLQQATDACEVRESAHATGGRYVLARSHGARLAFEWTSANEYLLRGECEAVAPLSAACAAVSAQLQGAALAHRIEVYAADDVLHAVHAQPG